MLYITALWAMLLAVVAGDMFVCSFLRRKVHQAAAWGLAVSLALAIAIVLMMTIGGELP